MRGSPLPTAEKRHKVLSLSVVGLAGIMFLTGCGNSNSNTAGNTAATTSPTATTAPAATTTMTSAAATTNPTATTTTLPGVGSTQTVAVTNSNGTSTDYTIKLGLFNNPSGLALAEFRVVDTGGGPISYDADVDATLVGSNGQTYQSDVDITVSYCPNFYDVSQLNPGQAVWACEIFVVPTSVSVSRVVWTPDDGISNQPVEWAVSPAVTTPAVTTPAATTPAATTPAATTPAATTTSRWLTAETIDPGANLIDVSCPDEQFCMAVDDSGRVLTYNEGRWGPPTPFIDAALEGVSCKGPDFCVAVGGRFAMIYNGSDWSAPSAIDPSNVLLDVSCPLIGQCIAVDSVGHAFSLQGGSWNAQLIDPGGRLHAVFSAPLYSKY